jgi:WD40 repeat protein
LSGKLDQDEDGRPVLSKLVTMSSLLEAESTLPLSETITSISTDKDGNKVAVASNSTLIEIRGTTELQSTLSIRGGFPITMSPNGRRVAAPMEYMSSKFGVWNTTSGDVEVAFNAFSASTTAFSSDSTMVAIGGFDHKIAVWQCDPLTWKTTLFVDQSRITALVYSPDGTMLAVGTTKTTGLRFPSEPHLGTAYLFDTSDNSLIRKWSCHLGGVTALCFMQERQSLATAGDDGSIFLWSLERP